MLGLSTLKCLERNWFIYFKMYKSQYWSIDPKGLKCLERNIGNLPDQDLMINDTIKEEECKNTAL